MSMVMEIVQFGTVGEDLGNLDNTNNNPSDTSPLEQFCIKAFLTVQIWFLQALNFTINSINLYLVLVILSILVILYLIKNTKIKQKPTSIYLESLYHTIINIILSNISKNKGQIYIPLLLGLFIYILICNLVGLIPYSFAITGHIILTLTLSFTLVIGSLFLGLKLHGFKFFSLFIPNGCPIVLLPLLIIIEVISYFARNISLGLRLGANIIAGHMLLSILTGFVFIIMSYNFASFFIGILPLLFIIAFTLLELVIAFIQAQVFVVLASSYIKDSIYLH